MSTEAIKDLSSTELCRKMFYLRAELRARGWTDDEINRNVAVEITDDFVINELDRFSEELKKRDLFE